MLNSHSYIKHLCLDEKIDYSKLAHNELQLSLLWNGKYSNKNSYW
nr:hypothetical protein [Mycoplasmopsis bovis]